MATTYTSALIIFIWKVALEVALMTTCRYMTEHLTKASQWNAAIIKTLGVFTVTATSFMCILWRIILYPTLVSLLIMKESMKHIMSARIQMQVRIWPERFSNSNLFSLNSSRYSFDLFFQKIFTIFVISICECIQFSSYSWRGISFQMRGAYD